MATEASQMEQEDAKSAKQIEAQRAREQELAAREQGELKVKLIIQQCRVCIQ